MSKAAPREMTAAEAKKKVRHLQNKLFVAEQELAKIIQAWEPVQKGIEHDPASGKFTLLLSHRPYREFIDLFCKIKEKRGL